MLQAQLSGKLDREEKNLEDLLTSNVFGSLSYVPLGQGLRLLLTSSQDYNGNRPTLDLQHASKVAYEFWPWVEEEGCKGCEPDVCITIELDDGRKMMPYGLSSFLLFQSQRCSVQLVSIQRLLS